ncbi:MAG TPA: GDSL-type esterase/lipase family protein [Methylomirabilota bacterium]|nr:GDSL-type esterase/lipase family protein [Methylomirabilota bacterium]
MRASLPRALPAVALAGLLLAAGPADAAFWLPPALGANLATRAIAVGDSITAGKLGEGVIAARPYPLGLQGLLSPQHPGVTVLNEGIPGAGVGDTLGVLPALLDSDHPIAVLIMVGTNDANNGHSPAFIVATLRQMLQVAKLHGVIPILASITPDFRDDADEARAIIAAVNAQLPAVAAEEGVRFVDLFAALNNPFFFRVDGLHPEQDGYDVMAAAWRPAVDVALNDALTLLSEVLLLRFDKESYRIGETLQVDLTVADDDGPEQLADVYFGALLPPAAGPGLGCPNQDAIAFIADAFTHIVLTCLADVPAAAAPLYRVQIPASLPLETVLGYWTLQWAPGIPPGPYLLFFILTPAGDRTTVLMSTSHALTLAP